MDRFIHLGMVAATEAMEDSGWRPESEDDKCATGVMIGSGIGGLRRRCRDGSLLGRIRRLLGATSSVDRPASGLAGTVVLAPVVLMGVGFVLAPAANQARAGVEPRDAIIGSVVTPDGKPVAGADVWLVAHLLTENRAVTFGKAQRIERVASA